MSTASADLHTFWGQDARGDDAATAADNSTAAGVTSLCCAPGPRTFMWVPLSLEPRFADLAIQLMVRACSTATQSQDDPDSDVQAHQWLRCLPEVQLRMPVTKPDSDAPHNVTELRTEQLLWGRMALC